MEIFWDISKSGHEAHTARFTGRLIPSFHIKKMNDEAYISLQVKLAFALLT